MLVLEGLRDGAVIPGMGDALNPGSVGIAVLL
jgi:hypothetical protein